MYGVVKFCIVYCRVHPSLEKVQPYTVHLTFVLFLLSQVLRSDPDPKGRVIYSSTG